MIFADSLIARMSESEIQEDCQNPSKISEEECPSSSESLSGIPSLPSTPPMSPESSCHLSSEDEYSRPASVCMDSDSDRGRDTQAKELQALLYGKPKGKTKVPAEAKKTEEKGKSWRAPKKRASMRGKHGKQQGPQKKTRADQSNFPQCPECDVRIANVSRHLRQAHNYTEAQVGLYKSDMPVPSGFALGIMSLHSKYLFFILS